METWHLNDPRSIKNYCSRTRVYRYKDWRDHVPAEY